MWSPMRESKIIQSKHFRKQSQNRSPYASPYESLESSRCHITKVSDDVLMLIFEVVFLQYGICGATCLGLAHRQLYRILKTFHQGPISLAARIEPRSSRTDLNCMDDSTFYPGVCLGTLLKDFMAPRYRPASQPEYRFLPVAKFGQGEVSWKEEGLKQFYVDAWIRQHKEDIKVGDPRLILMPWENSSGRFWDEVEMMIVKKFLRER